MRIAVIGADAESLHAIRVARQHGHFVVAVDKDPEAPGLKEADLQLNIDLSETEKVIEALRSQRIELVLTVPIGRHLATVGAVNDALSLPGISSKSAEYCTDKYAFHNRLRNVKLRTGHCYLVNERNIFDPDRMDYPAVFKPRYGSNSMSVHMVMDSEELKALEIDIWGKDHFPEPDSDDKPKQGPVRKWGQVVTEEKEEPKEDLAAFKARIKKAMEDTHREGDGQDGPDEDYILEEGINGVEYAADGVVEGCNYELMLIRRKILTTPPARQAVAYISVRQDEEVRLSRIIHDYMVKVCEALGLRDCMVHADLSVFGRKCMAIEVSASPAGHHIYDEFLPMVTGVDMCAQFLTYMSGEIHNFSPLSNKKMMLHYFNMENCFIHGIPSVSEIKSMLPDKVRLKKWECNMRMLDYMGHITDEQSLLGRGCFIIEGPNDETLLETADMIMGKFDIK